MGNSRLTPRKTDIRLNRRKLSILVPGVALAIRTAGAQERPATTTALAEGIEGEASIVRVTAARKSAMQTATPGATNGIEEHWRFETEGVIGSFGVVDDTLFITEDDDYHPTVYAVDLQAGTERWSLVIDGSQVDDKQRYTPTVVNGTVFLIAGDQSAPSVYALDARDGSERWHVETYGEIISVAPVALAAVGDTVFVGDIEGDVYALNAEDGTERWTFSTRKDPVTSIGEAISSIAVVEDTVFALTDDYVYAINAQVGTERRSFETSGLWKSLVVSDSTVFVIAGGGPVDAYVYAINAEDGAELWRFAAGQDVVPSLAVAGDTVFVITGYEVHAFSARDGSERWRFSSDDMAVSPLSVSDGIIFFGSNDYNVYAIDAHDGSQRWRSHVSDGLPTYLEVDDGAVFVCTGGSNELADSRMYVFDVQKGTERWRFDPDGYLGEPIVMGSNVLVPTANYVYALDAVDGSEQWHIETDVDGTNYQFPLFSVVADGIVYVAVDYDVVIALGSQIPRLAPGAKARIATKTTLRAAPNPSAVERAQLEQDTIVTLTGEPETRDDVVWWPVTVDDTGAMGWVEESALKPFVNG